MPLSSLGCSSCALVLTAALTLLLVPAPYFAPGLHAPLDDELAAPHATLASDSPLVARLSLDRLRTQFPPLDLLVTLLMLVVGFITYLCEWIQRKLMERRIVKLNQYLVTSVERLRAWDAQQEQLESTLRLVQGAAGEYNLLLFLLLRRRRAFDKLDDDLSYMPPTIDV